MPGRKNMILSFVIALGVAPSATSGFAQSLANDIVGTWALVQAAPFGPTPKGIIMFDANGHFSAILTRSDLPKFVSNNRTQGTPDEYKATVEGSLAFFGTYSVSGTDLNLHIVGSTFANWNGGDQKRISVSASAEELRFTQPTPSGGGSAEATIWSRMK